MKTGSRWIPVCPECRYQIRGLVQARCPECGNVFPSKLPTSRRWAIHRLPWDRRDRTLWLRRFVQTQFLCTFLPWSAGSRIAIPDRWLRTVLFGIGSLLIAAAIPSALTEAGFKFAFPWLYTGSFAGSPIRDAPFGLAVAAVSWLAILATFLFASIGASDISFLHNRIAFKCAVKWTLYNSSALIAIVVLTSPLLPFDQPQATRAPDTIRVTEDGTLQWSFSQSDERQREYAATASGPSWRVYAMAVLFSCSWTLGVGRLQYSKRSAFIRLRAMLAWWILWVAIARCVPWIAFSANTHP